MKSLYQFRTLGLVLLAATLLFGPEAKLNAQALPDQPEFVAGEVIVQFKTTASAQQLADVLRRGVLTVKEHLAARGRSAGESGLVLMDTRLPVAQAVAALQNHPAVDYAEPNVWLRHCAVANDPYYTGGNLWGMYGDAFSPANQYGSQANEAWANNHFGAPDVYIGVIDEGIDISHPDLVANIGRNPGETGTDANGNDKATNGIDDDGNGKIDDVYGWDFFHGDKTVFDGGDADGCADDHGTHVSGTIGAAGGNGLGVAGICWNVKIVNGKFLGPNGGSGVRAAEAIRYFIDLKQRHGLNIVALNNSWGGGAYNRTLHTAIIEAANAGILFVAAAGNARSNNDTTPAYPACYSTSGYVPWVATTSQPTSFASYDSVISVAALDSRGKLASFSNYGIGTVDLGAPGVSVWSTVPGGQYAAYKGTSMATPHVTGACALYAASHLDATPFDPQARGLEIKNAILNAAKATPTSSMTGKTATGGRLNVSGF